MAAETISSVPPAPDSKTLNFFNLDELLAYEGGEAPAKKAEPEEKPEEKPAPTKVNHSKVALAAGREVGLSVADMEGMSDDELSDEVYLRKSQLLNERENAAKAAGLEKAKEAPLDFGGADLTNVDDEIKRALDHVARENAALKAELAGQRDAVTRHQTQTVTERLDALFAGNAALFGAQSGARLAPRSREAARRSAVVNEMTRMHQAGEKTTLELDFAKACETLGYDVPPAADKGRADDWNNSGLARPAGRKSAELPKGEARAANAVSEALEKAGGHVVHGQARIDDVPD